MRHEINYVECLPMVHTVMQIWLKCWLCAPKMSRTSCIMKRISKEATLTGVTEQGRVLHQRASCVYMQAFKCLTTSSCEIGYFMCGWPCVILILKSWLCPYRRTQHFFSHLPDTGSTSSWRLRALHYHCPWPCAKLCKTKRKTLRAAFACCYTRTTMCL